MGGKFFSGSGGNAKQINFILGLTCEYLVGIMCKLQSCKKISARHPPPPLPWIQMQLINFFLHDVNLVLDIDNRQLYEDFAKQYIFYSVFAIALSTKENKEIPGSMRSHCFWLALKDCNAIPHILKIICISIDNKYGRR